MDSLFRGLLEDSASGQPEILKCPFLKNINEPTNFSFSSSMALPMPIRTGKGPIFEDGPNFDMAFRLFHGSDGVVPLSERSLSHSEKLKAEAASEWFNPLAARAATISLSSFGAPFFGFDASSENKKQKGKVYSSKKDSSSAKGGNSKQDAMRNDMLQRENWPMAVTSEWLRTGKCPIAKSYQGVTSFSDVHHYKRPTAMVAAEASPARTALAKNLRPQPLFSKEGLAIGGSMAASISLGVWIGRTKKVSSSGSDAVPIIAMPNNSVLVCGIAAILFLGQVFIYRLKNVAEDNSLPMADRKSNELHGVLGKSGDAMACEENSLMVKAGTPAPGNHYCVKVNLNEQVYNSSTVNKVFSL